MKNFDQLSRDAESKEASVVGGDEDSRRSDTGVLKCPCKHRVIS